MSALPARESMEFDDVVVGASPAGLASAIRLKLQPAKKGAEVLSCLDGARLAM